MPSVGVNPFKFLNEAYTAKTRVLGLDVGEDFLILACIVLTPCQHVADAVQNRRTDIPATANTGLCIDAVLTPYKNAGYSDTLQTK